MLLAIFVYSAFTKLGDTDRYLFDAPMHLDISMFYDSTSMMDTLGHTFYLLFGSVFAHIPFVMASFYGIYYAISRIPLSDRQLLYLLLLLSFPSFGIWTSIVSKEAVSVFMLGVILGFIIDIINKSPQKKHLLVVFAFYLCLVFKPQYIIGVLALLVFIFVSRGLSLNGLGKLLLYIIYVILSIFFLYLFRYEIDALSQLIPANFSTDAASTRENTIWVHEFDVFWNAPYGMFIAFFGPTVTEALSKPTHLLVFIESVIIIGLFGYWVLKLFLLSIITNRLNVYLFGIFFTVTPWILFVHYPFGVLNPGSAIRYRENFYGFLVILFYFICTKIQREQLNRSRKSRTSQDFTGNFER